MGQITPVDSWLQAAVADADRRGLPDLKPLLEGLAQATRALRAADFNETAAGREQPTVDTPQSSVDSRQS